MDEDEKADAIDIDEDDRRHKLWLIMPFIAFFLFLGLLSLATQPDFHAFWNKETNDTMQINPTVPIE